ncbi:MAG TPA: hypothetical protein VFC84_12750 [Desulfosporosinus sp.]|nr:hypothetical protein [Desulfosporosinus sp.]
MKLNKLCLVFIVLGLTITTVACSKKTAEPITGADNPPAITSPQPSNENTPATPSPTTKPSTSSPATPSPTQPSSSVEKAKFYYGTWIVKKYMPTTNVSSLSEKNINDYIGQKIVVDENQIVTNKGTIKNPIFEEKTLTETEFFSDWRVKFSNLEIIGDTVTQVKVSNYKNETGDEIGSELIFTKNNKTYTNIGGCFFELGK